ncbi:MAG TPA: PAS domain S-box protein [Dehalococcoidales bacterium]|nr:PAS domain S-box protein [Dehalococcoidales bacterium]
MAESNKSETVSRSSATNIFKSAMEFFQKSPIAVVFYGTGGSIIYVNPAFRKISGFNQSDLAGKLPPFPFRSAGAKSLNPAFFKTGSRPRQVIMQKKDGEQIWVETLNQKLKLGKNEAVILVYIQDISDRKKAAESARHSEVRFHKVLNALPLPLAITSLPERKFVHINKAFLLASRGMRREDFIGKPAPDLKWQNMSTHEQVDEAVARKKDISDIEMRLVSGDGKEHTALMSARAVKLDGREYTISVSTDITRLKETEKALRESESFNASLLRDAPDPILVIGEDSSIRFVNPAFLKYTGFSKKELLGIKQPFPWWPVDKTEAYRQQNDESILSEIDDLERLIIKKKGEKAWIMVSLRHVKEDGRVKYRIAVWRDITQRKKTEEALKAELLRRRILIDQSSDGIVILDQYGAVYEANQRFAEMIGYTPQEVKKLHVWDWAVRRNRDQLLEALEKTDEKGEHFETLQRRKDGSQYIVEISSNGAYFGGQKLIFCVCRDITRRKKMEETLNAELVRRRILIDQSSDGIVVLDQNGAVYETNRRFAEMLGYTPQEVLGLHVWDWEFQFPPEQVAEMIKTVDDKGDRFETKHRRKDGSTYDVEISTNGVMFTGQKLIFCVCRDITQRKKMEQELRESEHFNASLLNEAPNPILVTNTDGIVRYANPALEKLTGYSIHEIIGKNQPYPWWMPEKREEYLQESGQGFQQLIIFRERLYRKKNGEYFWVNVSICRIEDGGKLKFYLANWVDVTERKKMEENLAALYQKEKLQREQLEEEARLRGHFINVLAHELRTPITPILASTHMLKQMFSSQTDITAKKLIENILNSSNTLANRLEELLDMARHARGGFKLNRQKVQMKPFMEGVITRFEPTLQRLEQKLKVTLPDNLPAIEVDASRLEQVFINLLSNASKFSGEKTSIYLNVQINDRELRVDIRDEGIGISPEAQARLFQPYFRAEQGRRHIQGLGLGLAVSKQIVEAHEGKIWVTSEKGRGSTFSFNIPLVFTAR